MDAKKAAADVGMGLLILCVALAVAPCSASPALAESSAPTATRPPRSTPAPTATPAAQPQSLNSDGSAIELRVRPVDANWQSLWTIVQWQDNLGHWHDVDGWRGSLDEVAVSEGIKRWWVSRGHLGQGPFRWVVYDRPGGRLLAKSQAFNLPPVAGQTATVEIPLKP